MAHPFDPGTISTERDYVAALNELDDLMLCDPDTPAARRFDELVALIDAWELAHDAALAGRPPFD